MLVLHGCRSGQEGATSWMRRQVRFLALLDTQAGPLHATRLPSWCLLSTAAVAKGATGCLATVAGSGALHSANRETAVPAEASA
jgi:hypothetical protein